uniref:Uncharacterized protein n=4 Tax=environmental samples TaxID=651140 RepID=A0A075I900_9ARCH|nr:hypothetical protein [uncultured marine thaumarchaeote SAT1000_09_B07]AIF22362.1 hypothetical protein [uncultured marine thaumarchaeote SAT1000_09_B08]AIF22420.1 hypothetical protein [uncultured marine thaumarchaeote SAT1000_09_C07]AIF22478.1 hypothetical protein [uncultured marine thaumarchaeote SAT1000_09_C08]
MSKYQSKTTSIEKAKKRQKIWVSKNREKIRENQRKWWKENRESMSFYRKRYRVKNPVAFTKEMTKYRRSHRVCEWSYCEQIKSLHVHHILPNFKYKKKYTDGNYRGRIGNNFICYCPFHHFAYHCTYSIKRDDENHKSALALLWSKTEKWANDNKISFVDLEIELAQMLPQK